MRILSAFLLSLFLTVTAYGQGGGGSVTPEGTIIPGNCTKFGTTKFKVADAGAPCGSGGGSVANPTALVGLTPVNGVATSAIRSDGAPALDQGIAPTWTAKHKWVFGVTGVTPTNDAILEVAFDGDTYNATQFTSFSAISSVFDGPYVYGRYAYGTPTSPLAIGAGANLITLAGAGYNGSAFTGSRGRFSVHASENWTTTANGSEIRVLTTPNGSTAARLVQMVLNNGNTFVGPFSFSAGATFSSEDAFLTRAGTGVWQHGAANSSSPVPQTIQAQGSRAGIDTNVSGANLTITSGNGTGNSASSFIFFQIPGVVASGTGAQTMTTQLTLGSGNATFLGTINGTALTVDNPLTGNRIIFSNSGTVRAKIGSVLATSFSMWGDSGETQYFSFTIPDAGTTLQFGLPNTDTTGTAQVLQSQGVTTGGTNNQAGGNLTVASGRGKGNVVSSLILQTPAVGASGNTLQTMVTGLTINKGAAATAGYTIANLPTTPLTGSRAHVTDQLTTCATVGAALTAGGSKICPAFFDGTSWVGG